MALHLSHIARYAPSIQSHIHLKTFAQILTIVFKQPLIGVRLCWMSFRECHRYLFRYPFYRFFNVVAGTCNPK